MAPRNLPVRPTTDFAKEGIFNVLQNRVYFEDLNVLDLFSGTGNISYEFASRGAGQVTSVDLNFQSVQFIKKTAKELGFTQLRSVRSEAFRYLESSREQFDLIFADPPYELDKLPLLPNAVFKNKLLLPDGLLVIEHPKEVDFSEHPHFSNHRNYGKVNFSIFT